VPRLLGRISSAEVGGPTLICLAGLHGNEPAGVHAFDRVFAHLRERPELLLGEVVGLTGNRQALAAGRRFISRDLNRAWHTDRVREIRGTEAVLESEDRELQELYRELSRVFDAAHGRVFMVDIHTTSGPGAAFAILDDTRQNREMALDFPVPLVLGLEEELEGTLAGFLTYRGITVMGFEAGQHDDPVSVDRAEAAIWIALDSCEVVAPDLERVSWAREFLRRETNSAARIVEVKYRHHIDPGDGFEMAPGFASFQAIRKGQSLAVSGAGPVTSPREGLLLMPLYQEQGEDGYFLVQEVRPIWLSVSAALRKVRADRYLQWLPGVRVHPERPDAFVVDRRYARWLAPQLFHLMGFRREEKARGQRRLTLVRRRRNNGELRSAPPRTKETRS